MRISVPDSRLGTFAVLTILSALGFPAAVLFVRVSRPLFGLTPGQVPSLPATVAIASLALVLVSVLHGALFTTGVRMLQASPGRPSRVVSRVYVVETLGTILGGVLLALILVDRFSSLQIAFGVGVVSLIALCLPALALRRARLTAFCSLLTATGLGVALGLGVPVALEHAALRSQYPGNDVVWTGNSRYGGLTLLRRAEQNTIIYDGEPVAVLPSPDYAFVEEFAHVAMLSLPDPRRVLLIGGGLGGVLDELAKYPRAAIDYCELDPKLLSIARGLAPGDTSERRIRFEAFDGRRFLQGHKDPGYDLIVVGFEMPTTLQVNRFFTREFCALARDRLASGGILVLRAPGSTAYLSDELARLNAVQLATLRAAFPAVRVLPGDFNMYLASTDPGVMSLESGEMADRLAAAGLSLRFLTPEQLARRFSHTAEADFLSRISQSGETQRGLNTDQHPSEVLAALAFKAGSADSQAGKTLGLISRASGYLLPLLLVVLGACIGLGRRRRRFTLRFATFSTGLAGAASSLLLMLAFQVVAGTVYYNLILLTTSFMAGAALGGAWPGRDRASTLPLLDAANGLAVMLPLLAIRLLPGAAAQIAFYGAALVAGMVLGAEFIAVNREYGPTEKRIRGVEGSRGQAEHLNPGILESLNPSLGSARTAGGLYAADLLGGFFGALLVPAVLVPAFGMTVTAASVVLVKAASVAMLALSGGGIGPGPLKRIAPDR